MSTRSQNFRTWWARHDVCLHIGCVKHYRHPAVGQIQLTFECMALASAPGLSVVVLTPEPGTPDEESLRLLDSWGATVGAGKAAAPAAYPPSGS